MYTADMAQQITDLPAETGGYLSVQAGPVRRLCQSGTIDIQRGNVLGDPHDGERAMYQLPSARGASCTAAGVFVARRPRVGLEQPAHRRKAAA